MMLRPICLLRACAIATVACMAFAVQSHARGEQLFSLTKLCTHPSIDAGEVVDQLESAGWVVVPGEELEAAARFLGDGQLVAGHFSARPETIAKMREEAFRRSLAKVTRKTSDYFFSATLRSPDTATVVNIFWSKQGNRLQCHAATSTRDDIERLGSQIASMTKSGRMHDTGPSWHIRAATDGESPLRVWLSVLKQDTITLFSTDPLTATVGLFAEYFPRKG